MIIHFHGDLPTLLPRPWKGHARIAADLSRRTSIKDLVESYDVPHTEVGRLTVDGAEVDFTFVVEEQREIAVYPCQPPMDPVRPSLLRPRPIPRIAFAVDQNVGKLAPLLRMVGFDALYHHGISDPELAELAAHGRRILLTKDRDLLKRKKIEHGRLVRAIHPEEQLAEILEFYGLQDQVHPFTRCLRCNDGILEPVVKEAILHRLEPLTIKYYDEFFRCTRCDRIFWEGTHLERMGRQLTRLGYALPE